jgi:hypothetical protein
MSKDKAVDKKRIIYKSAYNYGQTIKMLTEFMVQCNNNKRVILHGRNFVAQDRISYKKIFVKYKEKVIEVIVNNRECKDYPNICKKCLSKIGCKFFHTIKAIKNIEV